MSTREEISKWLLERVAEIEDRNTDPVDPRSEDVRQLAKSLRYAMAGAQEIAKVQPQTGETLFRYAAKPFSEYDGYDSSWEPLGHGH